MTQIIEGNYLQQSLYLVFILILLTSVFFSTFTHVCHFIVFKSKFHFDLFFILNVVRLILCFNYSILFLVNSHSFFWYSFVSLLHYDTYVRELYYANHEALSIKTNSSCVNFIQQCFRWNYWSLTRDVWKTFQVGQFCSDMYLSRSRIIFSKSLHFPGRSLSGWILLLLDSCIILYRFQSILKFVWIRNIWNLSFKNIYFNEYNKEIYDI